MRPTGQRAIEEAQSKSIKIQDSEFLRVLLEKQKEKEKDDQQMSSIGTGVRTLRQLSPSPRSHFSPLPRFNQYDLSCTTFSPDGRVFQVEYANKAVDNSGTAVGVKCRDGVVLGVEKLVHSKMLVEGSNRRIHTVDDHIGFANAGLVADARQIVRRARAESQGWRDMYGSPVPTHVLCDRVGSYVQAHTLYAHLRPFGCSVLVAGHDEAHGARLFCVEPSGLTRGFFAAAVGKGRQGAKTELEKLRLAELSCRDALVEVARVLLLAHDEAKDKLFEIELSWLCAETNWTHQLVPKEIRDAVVKTAQEAIERAMESS